MKTNTKKRVGRSERTGGPHWDTSLEGCRHFTTRDISIYFVPRILHHVKLQGDKKLRNSNEFV